MPQADSALGDNIPVEMRALWNVVSSREIGGAVCFAKDEAERTAAARREAE